MLLFPEDSNETSLWWTAFTDTSRARAVNTVAQGCFCEIFMGFQRLPWLAPLLEKYLELFSAGARVRHLQLVRIVGPASLMSSWAQPATSVSSASWLDVFTRLQPGLLLCSGIYKNSPAIPKRCQAVGPPENIGYLISAVKVSQAEFNKKSKVPKLDEDYKACDCPSASSSIYMNATRKIAPSFVVRAASEKHDFQAFLYISIGFCVWVWGRARIDYANIMSHRRICAASVRLSPLSLHLLWDEFTCMFPVCLTRHHRSVGHNSSLLWRTCIAANDFYISNAHRGGR